ncbi:MAG: lipid asymmetry maintenance ABC transporter permease subunit MlaE [Gammaproteobacteria bacterium]
MPIRLILDFLAAVGQRAWFFGATCVAAPRALRRPALIVEQVFFVGSVSVILIGVGGLFVGLVLALQFYTALSRFGATSSLGGLVALALLRELGPVLTALLFAGRAGTSLASELGLMRATRQIDAMEVMAVDPMRRIVAPRFLAGIVSMPLLAGIFSAMGILGAYLVGVKMMGLDPGVFWSSMQHEVSFHSDFVNGLIKSAVFGAACTLIAVYEGFHARPSAEGVGQATTRSVVISSMAILALDFILTAFMY